MAIVDTCYRIVCKFNIYGIMWNVRIPYTYDARALIIESFPVHGVINPDPLLNMNIKGHFY